MRTQGAVLGILALVGFLTAVETTQVVFEKDLFVGKDLNMRGVQAIRTLVFTKPPDWELTQDPVLHLIFSHSEVLLPYLSAISIRVNDLQIRSFKLTPENVEGEEAIPIPRDILQDYNTLQIIVDQHYTEGCEDPFSAVLWTTVSRHSYIEFTYNRLVPKVSLDAFPYPLFDGREYGKRVFAFVLSDSASLQTLTAMGYLATALGRLVSYRDMEIKAVRTLEESRGYPTIVVGTQEEHPVVRRYLSEELRGASKGLGLIVYRNHPLDPTRPLLIVTGTDAVGVLKAAKALVTEENRKALSGQMAWITDVADPPKVPARKWPGFIPDKPSFTLEEVGFEDQTVRGYYSSPVSVNLFTQPDSRFREAQQRIVLEFSYSAGLDPRLSEVEVRVNGVSLRSRGLRNKKGEQYARLKVDVPYWLLIPYNKLDVIFHLFPEDYDPCRRVSDKHIWATVHKTTRLNMPRDYWIDLPDLSALQYGGFPYTLYQDLRDLAFVLPDRYGQEEMTNLLLIAGYLGKVTQAPGIFYGVYKGSGVPQMVRDSAHVIALGWEGNNSFISALAEKKAIRMTQEGRKTIRGLLEQGETSPSRQSFWSRLFGRRAEAEQKDTVKYREILRYLDTGQVGIVEQAVSPWSRSHTVLVFYGRSPESQRIAVQALYSPAKLHAFGGNLVFISPEGEVRYLDIARKVRFGHIPPTRWLRIWFLQRVFLLPVLILVLLLLLYITARATVLRIKRRRIGPEEELPEPEEYV